MHVVVTECKTDGECAYQTIAERSLRGMWVIDEVRLAIQKGYEVVEIFDVYEDAVTRNDTQTGQGGIFIQYIDKVLKMKTEASGSPDWV